MDYRTFDERRPIRRTHSRRYTCVVGKEDAAYRFRFARLHSNGRERCDGRSRYVCLVINVGLASASASHAGRKAHANEVVVNRRDDCTPISVLTLAQHHIERMLHGCNGAVEIFRSVRCRHKSNLVSARPKVNALFEQ